MADIFDVIVIGAGIQGSSAAHYLAKQRKKTLLLEQYPLLHGRGSSHGHSRLIRCAYPLRHWYYSKMVSEAKSMWRQLEKETSTEIYKQIGVLSIGLDPKHLEPVEKAMTEVGISYRKLDTTQLRTEYPMVQVEDSSIALWEGDAGIILADKGLQAFLNSFRKQGGTIRDNEMVLSVVPGDIVKVRTVRGEYKAHNLIITAGPWTPRLLKPLGLNLPLEPWKVTVLYWKELHPGMFSSESFPAFRAVNAVSHNGQYHNLYGCPAHEYPGMFKLCLHEGTVADPGERDKDSDDWDIDLVSEFIREHLPDLESKPSIIDRCFYTMTPDIDFIMDNHPRWKNIVIGAGFSGHGFKLAPVIGRTLSELAIGQQPAYDMTPFSISRFTKKAPKSSL